MKPTGALRAARRARRMVPTLAAAALFSTGCSGDAADGPLELEVFAASSLTEAFAELEEAFEAANPDVDVLLTFAGSQVLRLQIEQGARADVFASANEAHAAALNEAGLADEAHTLAWNALVLIVPADRGGREPEGGPTALTSFADLPNAERLVIGSEAVPVGAYTRTLLERAGRTLGPDFAERVRARVVSEESNVRLVRAKVELGEADAAIVYRTDALASERVHTIGIPPGLAVRARYVIAALGDGRAGAGSTDAQATVDGVEAVDGGGASGRTDAAARFIAFARSPTGAAILERHGFEGPES